MNELSGEDGVILVLIKRFEKQRLPRLLELKKRADWGGVPGESGTQYLDQVMLEARRRSLT